MRFALVIPLMVTLAVCIYLFLFTTHRQDRDRSRPFSIICVSLILYALGYLLESLCLDERSAFIALLVENAGIPLIGPFFMLGVLSLYYPEKIKNWMTYVALLYGFIMFTMVLFNDTLHLYYNSIDMRSSEGGALFVQLTHGPLFLVQQGVSVSCMLAGFVMLIRSYISAPPGIRVQMGLFMLGALIAFVANIINIMGVLAAGIDLMPFALAAAMTLFCIGMSRYKLLDLVPLAFSAAVESMDDAVVVLDKDEAYQFSNDSAKQLFSGLGALSGNDKIADLPDWPSALLSHTEPCDIKFQKKDDKGATKYFRDQISRIRSDNGESIGWTHVIRDITDYTEMIAQLEQLATTDELTGILNRRHFLAMVKHEMDVAARLDLTMSLIMYDLDFFKEINDTYGHVAGDYVLCAVAKGIQSQLRPYDVFARYGGEEFVIFTTNREAIDLEKFANRLRLAVEKAEIAYQGHRILVTASFGAAVVKPNTKFATALHSVDMAMYKAKANGRNQVIMATVEEQ